MLTLKKINFTQKQIKKKFIIFNTISKNFVSQLVCSYTRERNCLQTIWRKREKNKTTRKTRKTRKMTTTTITRRATRCCFAKFNWVARNVKIWILFFQIVKTIRNCSRAIEISRRTTLSTTTRIMRKTI